MAQDNLTLLDVAKRLDPDGSASAIAELLGQDNEILTDMPFVEGNLPTGHRVTVRTGLPDVAWRKLNQGVPASKSRTEQIDEACGLLEARGEVDCELANLNGNTTAFRMQENAAFIEALNQQMASTMFYGDTAVTPERFLGLSTRFSSLSAENADNIVTGGGASNLTSIWLVGWAPSKVFGIYPKGSKAGLTHKDLGEGDAFDASNNRFRAYMDQYVWRNGVAVQDWRYVVRIPNIDVTALTKGATAGADLIDLMTRSLERIQSLTGVTPAFYCNRTIRSFLRRQVVNKVSNSTLSIDAVGGKPTLSFSEVPVRRVDALLNTESVVA
jgi:hypothetical protein